MPDDVDSGDDTRDDFGDSTDDARDTAADTDDDDALAVALGLLGELDTETLADHAATALAGLDSEADRSVDGPATETALRLARDRVPRDDYQAVAREVTAAVLATSPRDPATVRLLGVESLCRAADDGAVETLTASGVAADGDSLVGDCPATDATVAATLSLYVDGLIHAHFLDADGDAVAARHDGTLQRYWLPADAVDGLHDRLDPAVADAVVTVDRE